MSSPRHSKTKGRTAENAVVAWLHTVGWPHAERRRLTGARDKGDIAGVVGVTLEIKDNKAVDLAGWVGELQAEMANTGDRVGAVIAKRRGHPRDVGQWYAVLPADVLAVLLKEAGY